jgi:hypothetical protein
MGGKYQLDGQRAAGRRFGSGRPLPAGTAYAIIRLMKQDYRPGPNYFGGVAVGNVGRQNGAGQ